MIFPDWPAPDHVRAATTTRQGGGSSDAYASFNLATHVGDAKLAVAQNRARLRNVLQLPGEPLWLNQVHGDAVVDAVVPADTSPSADASFSFRPGKVCAVLTADCLPVLFCDRAGTRVAAAHAGWRGLAGGVLERTIEALEDDPGNLMAWLGPAIGPRCFEVGEEVRSAFTRQHPQAAEAFVNGPGGRWLADLYRLAGVRLQAAGVHAIYGGGLCTYSDCELWYSYRRDGVTGRMASLVWLA